MDGSNPCPCPCVFLSKLNISYISYNSGMTVRILSLFISVDIMTKRSCRKLLATLAKNCLSLIVTCFTLLSSFVCQTLTFQQQPLTFSLQACLSCVQFVDCMDQRVSLSASGRKKEKKKNLFTTNNNCIKQKNIEIILKLARSRLPEKQKAIYAGRQHC